MPKYVGTKKNALEIEKNIIKESEKFKKTFMLCVDNSVLAQKEMKNFVDKVVSELQLIVQIKTAPDNKQEDYTQNIIKNYIE